MNGLLLNWLRKSVNSIEDLFKELKFEYRVLKYRKFTPSFNSNTNIFTFSYENKIFKIKVPEVRDFISFKIIRYKTFFDLSDLKKIRHYIDSDSVVIDAGANIGSHSIYYAGVCKAAKVLSFEPQEEIYSILVKNIELNELEHRVIPYKIALGEHTTKASINFRDDHRISTNVMQTNHGGVYLKEEESGEFEVRTLDDLFIDELDRLDFIKMDIQGFEEKAIKGGKELIKKFKPVVQLECISKEEYTDIILPLMSELGYEIKQVLNIDYVFAPKV